MRFSPVLPGPCLVAPACGSESEPETLVSDFQAPSLQGLVVRDHSKGAEVVNRFETPWITYDACVVFTSVNGAPVRDAAHFRDLTNALANAAATDASGEISLSHTVLPPHERRDCERRAGQAP
jgi:hypothetical protein